MILSDDDIKTAISRTVKRGRRKGWKKRKMRQRVRWRLAALGLWRIGTLQPFWRPTGGRLIDIGKAIEEEVR